MRPVLKTAVLIVLVTCLFSRAKSYTRRAEPLKERTSLYKASDPRIQYVGRIDFSNKELPRFWAPGVYIKLAFKGAFCEILVNDEELWGGHNYISVIVDGLPAKRIKLSQKSNRIKIAEGLDDERHLVTICKSTESGIGYIEFVGVRCKKLVEPPSLPKYKMEFIGNSITCGTGSDLNEFPCGTGKWYDQHNAYLSYGPLTARALDAQWQLTSVSGIGLTRNCCGGIFTMPQVFDKVNLRENTIAWDFKRYQPDIVTICLGQNDGVVDSAAFCSAYVNFISRLRSYYPSANLICLTSPMADSNLLKIQKKYLSGVVSEVNNRGDLNVHKYFFRNSYQNGCDSHPSLAEHKLIAEELTGFIQGIIITNRK